jgi:ketosteroid isomerase-like protein
MEGDAMKQPDSALDVVNRFNEAFNRHDVDGVMALMTDDCIFEGTAPPNGRKFVGATAVRKVWEAMFRDAPAAHFETEETLTIGHRVVQGWRYTWGDGHVRGVDIFRVRDGKVAEKLSYVKG